MPLPAGRTPILPPLKSKFAIIERQREEEAALGEQGLDSVLSAVPVPQVCVCVWGGGQPSIWP